MAVLQHDPRSFLQALLNHLQSDGALALTQRQGVKLRSSEALGGKKNISRHLIQMGKEKEKLYQEYDTLLYVPALWFNSSPLLPLAAKLEKNNLNNNRHQSSAIQFVINLLCQSKIEFTYANLCLLYKRILTKVQKA